MLCAVMDGKCKVIVGGLQIVGRIYIPEGERKNGTYEINKESASNLRQKDTYASNIPFPTGIPQGLPLKLL